VLHLYGESVGVPINVHVDSVNEADFDCYAAEMGDG
jgi:hypothetical protein